MTWDFGTCLAVATLLALPWLYRHLNDWLKCPTDQTRHLEPSALDGFTIITFGDGESLLVPDEDLLEAASYLGFVDGLPEMEEVA